MGSWPARNHSRRLHSSIQPKARPARRGRLWLCKPTLFTCSKAAPKAVMFSTGWRPRLACSPSKTSSMNPQPQLLGGATLRDPNHVPVSPPQRILVVDDDAQVRRISAKTLRGFGYEVNTAEDGAAAWEAIQAESYDLLLTDHNMPKLTGIELAQNLWAARMTLPVILASGAPPTDELRQHPWLKFAAILTKPFATGELLAKVKAALHASDDAQPQAGDPFMFPPADSRPSRPSSRWGLNE